MNSIRREDIVTGVRQLGVSPGDWVFFHTSMRSFGAPVAGGADAVIDAVLEAVYPGGTVAVPTHSDAGTAVFERSTAPHDGMGVVPRVFLARPEALRSCHPTHSDAAIGPDAERLLEGHERCSGAGEGCPLDKLRVHPRGKVLLIGVGLDRLTLLHLAEKLAGAPYIGPMWRETDPEEIPVRLWDGRVVRVRNLNSPGCSDQFVRADPVFERAGIVREAYVGLSRIRAMPAGPVVDIAAGLVRGDPRFFLNEPGHCDWCRRANLKLTEAMDL
jgi:aminoglycoside 3-N-acetyltransferase